MSFGVRTVFKIKSTSGGHLAQHNEYKIVLDSAEKSEFQVVEDVALLAYKWCLIQHAV